MRLRTRNAEKVKEDNGVLWNAVLEATNGDKSISELRPLGIVLYYLYERLGEILIELEKKK